MKMVKADSELIVDDTLQYARNLLQVQIIKNGQIKRGLEKFSYAREARASCFHTQIPGNRGYHGNATIESYHSSVLVNLNYGSNNGNDFNIFSP